MEPEAAEPDATIVVEKVVDRKDLLWLVRRRTLRSARVWVFAAFGLIFGGGLIFLGIVALRSSQDSVWAGLLFLVVGLFLLIRLGLLPIWGPWWGVRRGMKRIQPETFEFSESGVRMRAQLLDVSSPWENFPRTTELGAFYVLRRSKPRGVIHISRRGFGSHEDEGKFRDLIRRKTVAQLSSDFPER
jgi:hypothetical protein